MVGLPSSARRLARELAKFGTVGLVALVVDVGTFNLLRFAGGEGPLYDKPLTAKVISVVLATIVAYLGNRFWTYRNRRHQGYLREYVLFFVFNMHRAGHRAGLPVAVPLRARVHQPARRQPLGQRHRPRCSARCSASGPTAPTCSRASTTTTSSRPGCARRSRRGLARGLSPAPRRRAAPAPTAARPSRVVDPVACSSSIQPSATTTPTRVDAADVGERYVGVARRAAPRRAPRPAGPTAARPAPGTRDR